MPEAYSPPRPETLTDRERDILLLLDQGHSDREIARQLFLSPGTVKWYNRQIYGKLGVGTRTQALARAREDGLLATAVAPAPPQPGVSSRHNLPAQLTPFIGRQAEVAAIRGLLATHRLLTLTGTGGTGKTRLALEVGLRALPDFPDGITFVPLAPLPDPAEVLASLGEALDVQEVGREPFLATLKRALAAQRALLIFDNFEHLLPAAPLLAELLAAAPQLHCLVTSRVALGLYGEQEYGVPPLGLPDGAGHAPGDLGRFPAIALFVQTARAVRPDFALTAENGAAVVAICQRLDGLPLAIELAAAQLRWLSPEVVLSRLGNRLATLTGGSRDRHPRQQTLRQTLDWSYQLLDDAQCRLFARLAVFAGGCTLDAVAAICGDGQDWAGLDQLGSLVAHSLVRQWLDINNEPRFGLLETIREYAWEHLAASGEADAVRARHAAYFAALARRGDDGMRGDQQLRWLNRLETEHDNFRAVLHWAASSGAAELGLQLTDTLSLCWLLHGHMAEGLRAAEQFLALDVRVPRELRARVLVNASFLAYQQEDFPRSAACAREGLALAEVAGDRQSIAWAQLCLALGQIRRALPTDDFGESLTLLHAALAHFQGAGDRWGAARTLKALGVAAAIQGNHAEAKARYEAALAIFRALSNPWGIAKALLNLGELAQDEGDFALAERHYRESLHVAQALDDRCVVANTMTNLGQMLEGRDPARAATCLAASEALYESVGRAMQASARPAYERKLAGVRAQLDPATFDAAWATGRSLACDQAIRFGLALLAPDASLAAVR